MPAKASDMLSLRIGRRLPIILQDEIAECGLASLTMIANFYGIKTDLRAMRNRFPITPRGLTLQGLSENANKFGFSTRAVKCGLKSVGQLKLPAIIHWDLNHFVVIKSVGRNSVKIHDPARGASVMKMEEFGDHFTGIALELTPNSKFKKTDERSNLKFSSLWSSLTGLGGSLAQILIFSLVMQIFVIASPQYLQLVIDAILPTQDRDLLIVVAVGFFLLLVINLIASVLRQLVLLYAGTTLAYQISSNLFHRLVRLPLTYFQSRHMGDILSRFESIKPIQDFLVQGVIRSVIDGVMAIITLILMFVYSPFLTAVVLIATGLYLLLRLILLQKMRQLTEDTILSSAQENSNFIETLRGILPIKAYADEANRQLRWQNLLTETFNSSIRLQRLNITFETAQKLIFQVERIIVVFFAAGLVIQANFTVGMIFAFMAYRGQFVESAVSLVEVVIDFRMLRLHLNRMADIALTDPEREGGLKLDIERGSIKTTDLSFSYGDTLPPVLLNVNLEIKSGESVALTGPSGGGKSTLLHLLMGLLEPQSGSVLIDDIRIDQVDLGHFRHQIASVMQDDHLFSGSLADNISLFALNPEFDRIVQAAQQAQIHDDIMATPMGYETLVGDMGASLSGGQVQRIILARALYSEPKIIFVDEGTSSLDGETEKLVNTAIANLGITRVIVAHRKETIESTDRILLIQNGTVTSI